jgi:hypothetical protein
LRGFATVALQNGLTIVDCAIFAKDGRAWAALPARPMIGRDGQQLVIDGKRQYEPILQWRDREQADQWSAAVITLVRAEYPEALP